MDLLYEFKFTDGQVKKYQISINTNDLTYVLPENSIKPDWTKLDFEKCNHCPLKAKDHPYCPIALNLAQLVEDFKDQVSYQEATVRVITDERTYEKTLDLQHAIFSIFGLIMATSKCPYMTFLRPMAKFHLPFSTSEETTVRSISMHLLKQYFIAKEGGKPDLTLKDLESKYEQLKLVNSGFMQRLQSIVKNDADANALIILHSISTLLTRAIGDNLSELKPYFQIN